jgi:hypothetical protein
LLKLMTLSRPSVCLYPPQMPRRYDIQQDSDELWTVYDMFTGWPAELDGLVLAGICAKAANEFVDVLNRRDRNDRMAKGGFREEAG